MVNSVRWEIQQAFDNYDNYPVKTLVTAVRLPSGATEIAINTENLKEKLRYILGAYNDDMCLKTNPDIVMTNVMIVH